VNLKTQTDYALRTLLYLAFVDEKVTAERIADAYRISKDHLVKVIQQLARLGYVRSLPGRTGGVKLAKPAGQINLADVISDFEGRQGVLACVSDPTVCNLEPGCLLRVQLIKAERAFYDTLRPFTIADLIKPARRAETDSPAGGMYNLGVPAGSAARTDPG
jgi:Rrf2 family nitric oxide-sensitive transcriptional repressor